MPIEIDELTTSVAPRFFGKYRGTVASNVDPLLLGRVQVSCPAVLGSGQLSWALPCTPYAGNDVGLFLVPPVGANVWVEFEAGDPDVPILGGCFWGTGEVPAAPALAEMKVLKTDSMTIELSDLPGAGGHHGRRVVARRRGEHLDLGDELGRRGLGRRLEDHALARLGVDQRRRAGGDVMPGFLLSQGVAGQLRSPGHRDAHRRLPAGHRRRPGGHPAQRPWTIAGCPFPPPTAGNGPCVTGTFTSGTVRVTASKQPLAIQAAPGTCVPTGVPLLVMQTQVRVRAS